MSLSLKGLAIFQAVSYRLLTAEPRTRSQFSLCEICGAQMAVGQFSLPVLLFSLAISFLPILHIHLYLHIAIARRTNGQSLGKFPK